MCVYFVSFTGFTVHHNSSVTFFPLTLAFFYSAVIKSIFCLSKKITVERRLVFHLTNSPKHSLVSSMVERMYCPLSVPCYDLRATLYLVTICGRHCAHESSCLLSRLFKDTVFGWQPSPLAIYQCFWDLITSLILQVRTRHVTTWFFWPKFCERQCPCLLGSSVQNHWHVGHYLQSLCHAVLHAVRNRTKIVPWSFPMSFICMIHGLGCTNLLAFSTLKPQLLSSTLSESALRAVGKTN
jgi:hypothetical protein